METIHSYFTTGLCGTCYRELPATVEYRNDGAAYITKTCPVHGYHEAMVERDYKFFDSATQRINPNATFENYNKVTLIEATDRCNLACKHCYHMPDNDISDKSVEWVVKMADIAPTKSICLAGAEPTVRQDLFDLIYKISQLDFLDQGKRNCSIYTNGIKLQNYNYVKKLKESNLAAINMSVHHPEYHESNVWPNVQKAIDNCVAQDIGFGQISFTVETKKQLEYALDKMLDLMQKGKRPTDFCVRSPAEIGWDFDKDSEIFASDIANWFQDITKKKDLKFRKHPNHGSNPYHVGFLLEEIQTIQIIHWPNVNSVDTSYMYMGPYAMMMPNTFGTFVIQAILRDGVRKGWYQGHRLQGFDNEKNIDFSRLVRPSDISRL